MSLLLDCLTAHYFPQILGYTDDIKYINNATTQYVTSPCIQRLIQDNSDVVMADDLATQNNEIKVSTSSTLYTASPGFPHPCVCATLQSVDMHIASPYEFKAAQDAVVFSATEDPGPLHRAEWIEFLATFMNLEVYHHDNGHLHRSHTLIDRRPSCQRHAFMRSCPSFWWSEQEEATTYTTGVRERYEQLRTDAQKAPGYVCRAGGHGESPHVSLETGTRHDASKLHRFRPTHSHAPSDRGCRSRTSRRMREPTRLTRPRTSSSTWLMLGAFPSRAATTPTSQRSARHCVRLTSLWTRLIGRLRMERRRRWP